ncbi:hypothetical protein D3C72_2195930 [compost metagenome]
MLEPGQQHLVTLGVGTSFQPSPLLDTEPPLAARQQADAVDEAGVGWLVQLHRGRRPARCRLTGCTDPACRERGKPQQAGDGEGHQPCR